MEESRGQLHRPLYAKLQTPTDGRITTNLGTKPTDGRYTPQVFFFLSLSPGIGSSRIGKLDLSSRNLLGEK